MSRADRADWRRVERFYRDRKYRGLLDPDAAVVIARLGRTLIGVGRVQTEEGQLVLRGMRVDPLFARGGVGTRILTALMAEVGDRSCYCIAYSHLREFYGRAGFLKADPAATPAFLRNRLRNYRDSGLDVMLMRR